MYHTIGSKYEETKYLDITQIAKLVKADLWEKFIEFKPSVRIQRYSMGQSLLITLKATYIREGHNREIETRIKREVTKITDQYNFDDSDSMSDHFHVRFYTAIFIN